MSLVTDEISLYERAMDALARGDLKQASGLCRLLMEREPSSAQAHHLMSSLFKATGNYRKAFDYASQATLLDDCVAGYHLQQGYILFALASYEQAAESFRRASDLSPGEAEPLVLLGDCMRELEHFDAAHSWYEKAAALSASSTIALAQAECFDQSGDETRAEAILAALMERKPPVAGACFLLARMALMRGELERAEYLLAKTKRYEPDHLLADFYLALLSIHHGEERVAVDYILQLLKREPTHIPALLLLGNLFLALDETASAKKSFQHVLALNSTHLLAWQNILQIAQDEASLSEQFSSLQALIAQASHPLPLRHLRAIYKGDVPPRAPKEYVAMVYNSLMQSFGCWIAANQDERPLQEISQQLRKRPEIAEKRYISLLDLGCNLGGMGHLMNDIAAIRVGVDVAAQMIKQSRRSKQYDVLYELDLVEYALASESSFDVVVIGGALRWFGNLQPVFHALRNVMHHDSLCAMIMGKEPSTLAYTVQQDGRYLHSAAYIRDVANAEGFTIVEQKDLNWVEGDATMDVRTLTLIKKTTLH